MYFFSSSAKVLRRQKIMPYNPIENALGLGEVRNRLQRSTDQINAISLTHYFYKSLLNSLGVVI